MKLLVHLLRNFGEHQIIVSLTQEKHALFQALLNRYLSDSTALSENITLVCPDSEEYGKALALSGYVITDGPLPYYSGRKRDSLCCFTADTICIRKPF